MQILKYPLPVHNGEFVLWLPNDAKILSVQTQDGQPVLWAMVDSAWGTECRRFSIIPTGLEFSAARKVYVGTFQQEFYAWHLFEVVRC